MVQYNSYAQLSPKKQLIILNFKSFKSINLALKTASSCSSQWTKSSLNKTSLNVTETLNKQASSSRMYRHMPIIMCYCVWTVTDEHHQCSHTNVQSKWLAL